MKKTHLTKTEEAIADAVGKFDACRHEEAIADLERYRDTAIGLSPEESLAISNNLAAFSRGLKRFDEALRIHEDAARLADDETIAPRRRGQFHSGYAATLYAMGAPTRDEELLRAAIIEYTAAAVYYERAYEYLLRASVENNLAVIKAMLGLFEEALDHVANALGSCGDDEATIIQVIDTKALIAIEAGDPRRAVTLSREAEARARLLKNERLIRMCLKTSHRAEAAVLLAEEEKDILETLERCGWNLTHVSQVLGFNSLQAFKQHLRRHFPRIDAMRVNRSVQSKKEE